jgi:hypothetical protein
MTVYVIISKAAAACRFLDVKSKGEEEQRSEKSWIVRFSSPSHYASLTSVAEPTEHSACSRQRNSALDVLKEVGGLPLSFANLHHLPVRLSVYYCYSRRPIEEAFISEGV